MRECTDHSIALTQELAEDIIAAIDCEGLWGGLGDGQTLEDIICQKLAEHGADRCPNCGRPVVVSEKMLGDISMQMLAAI